MPPLNYLKNIYIYSCTVLISKRYVTNKVLHPRGAKKRLAKFDLGKFVRI